MNCKEAIRQISNFIDGDLDPALETELRNHLRDCRDCRLVVDQTKRTVEIFCDSEPVELPADVRTRLHEALQRKFKEAAQ